MRPTSLAVVPLALAALLPGCLVVAAAAVAAGVVHVTSEDTVEVYFNNPYDKVFDAAEQELVARGGAPMTDRKTGKIEASLGHSSVSIQVTGTGDKSTRIEVKARKNQGISPDIDRANQIATGVSKRVGVSDGTTK
ncbi:MAG TPA: hypothetical protein VKE69_14655 [Planctomycetota bacterium]|nr:hypothetical protein [Planctomycetota bacterium]